MLSLEPPHLPTELFELIIDEVSNFPQVQDRERSQSLCAIALVCHAFRHRANQNRFAHISFYRRLLSNARVHSFLDLIQSRVWTEITNIACHVRTIVISLGIRTRDKTLAPHPTLQNGSMATILSKVFRSNQGATFNDHSLVLSTHISARLPVLNANETQRFDWTLLPDSFVAVVRNLCFDSSLTTLQLSWLTNVPGNFLSSLVIKNLRVDEVYIIPSMSSAIIARPFQSLEVLHVHVSPGVDLALDPSQTKVFGTLKNLAYQLESHSDVMACSKTILHTMCLQTLALRIASGVLPKMPMGFIDPKILSSLMTLEITLDVHSNPYKRPPRTLSQQVIDMLQPKLPPITRLSLAFENTRTYTPQCASNGVNDTLKQIDTSSLDSFLAASLPESVTEVTIRMSTLLRTAFPNDRFQSDTFRREESKRVRKHFPQTALRKLVFRTVIDVTEM